MSKIVVGLFKSMSEAERVKSEIIARGYPLEDVKVVANGASGINGVYDKATTGEESIGEKISNFFKGFTGGHHDDHDYYSEGITRGGALVAVSVSDDRADETSDLLDDFGAEDIDEGESPAYTESAVVPVGTSTTTYGQEPIGSISNHDQTAIPIVEEELIVGKREVQRGGVRVYSRIVETPVEENVQLREERVLVERRPVDRPAMESDFITARDQTIELTETVEEPVVTKSSRVVEEVLIGKEATQRTETIRDTVRKTEVDVENIGESATNHQLASENVYLK